MQNSRARIVNPLFDKLMTGMCYLAWIKYTKNLREKYHDFKKRNLEYYEKLDSGQESDSLYKRDTNHLNYAK